MSIVSHEIASNGSVTKHTFWRENDDGTRQALLQSVVPVGQFIVWDFPPGVLNVVEETAYEFETYLERDTPRYDPDAPPTDKAYDEVLPVQGYGGYVTFGDEKKKKRRWRKK